MHHTTSLTSSYCCPHLSVPKPTNTFPSVQPSAHFKDLQQQQQKKIQKQQGGRATGTAVHLSPTADVGSPEEEEEEEEAWAAMTATTGAFERRGDSILEVGGAIADHPIELGAANSGVSTCNVGGLSVRANLLVPS